MRLSLWIAFSFLTLASSGPHAQRQTFRTAVNVITCDVVVTDEHGRPINGLGREDFEIREDGRLVDVEFFQAIDIANAAPGETIPVVHRSGSVVASNERPLDGRLFVLLLDDTHISFSAGRLGRAKQIARGFVERLGATDQAAIVASSGRRHHQVEFTNDKARLLAATDHLFGFEGPAALPVSTLLTLRRIAEALAPIENRRKAIVLISEGFPIGIDSIEGNDHFGSMLDLLRAAQRANVAIYTFDPSYAGNLDNMVHEVRPEPEGDTSTTLYARDGTDSLRIIADNTGGRAAVGTNLFDAAVDRMIIDNGSYYLLGYYQRAADDGKFHRLRVEVKQPGVTVRARRGYVAPKREQKRGDATQSPLDALVAAPLQISGLDLRATAVPMPSSARSGSSILVVTEISGAELASAAALEFVALAVDMDGKVRASDRTSGRFRQGVAAGDARWLRLASRLDVPKGRYQLRIAVRRADGEAQGSVFTQIEVPDFGRDLSLGGLAIGTRRTSGVWRADQIASLLPVTPIAVRDLPADIEFNAAIRLRARRETGDLEFVATIVGPDGDRTELNRIRHAARAYAGKAGGVYEVPLDLSSFAAGEHRLLVHVTQNGRSDFREIAFRLRK